MKNLFRMDSGLWRLFEFVSDLFVANILFLILSIPIVTLGASITALLSVYFKRKDNRLHSAGFEFLHAFVENFKQSTVVWVLYTLFLIVSMLNIYAPLQIWGNSKKDILMVIGIAIMFITITTMYCFGLIARYQLGLKEIITRSFVLGIACFQNTIAMIIIPVFFVVISVSTYSSMMMAISFWAMIGFGLIGYLESELFIKTFQRIEKKDNILIKEEIIHE